MGKENQKKKKKVYYGGRNGWHDGLIKGGKSGKKESWVGLVIGVWWG